MSISDVQNTSKKDVLKTFILAPQWTSFQRLQRHKKTSNGRNFAQWVDSWVFLDILNDASSILTSSSFSKER